MILATMGYGTVGWIVEFPCGRPSALSSVASTWKGVSDLHIEQCPNSSFYRSTKKL